MELKRLMSQFIYRIESKPEGGFIAQASDPTVPAIQAATREELQQKIQATIAAGLAAQFPGLKLAPGNEGAKFAFHIERKADGGFAIQSADPNAPSIEGATHEAIESQFAEKLINFVGKHLAPAFSQALAQQGGSGDIKVFVNRKTFTLKAGGNKISFGNEKNLQSADAAQFDDVSGNAKPADASVGSAGVTISNRPITPESSSSWVVVLFLLGMLVVGALMYFFFHYR